MFDPKYVDPLAKLSDAEQRAFKAAQEKTAGSIELPPGSREALSALEQAQPVLDAVKLAKGGF